MFFYVKLMLFPFDLAFYYGFDMLPFRADRWEIWTAIILTVVIVIFSLLALIRRRSVAAFGAIFFMIAISMYANFFVPVAGIVAERLTFIASFGYCIAVASFLFWIGGKSQTVKNKLDIRKIAAIALAAVMLLAFSIKTFDRNRDWKDHLTLFRADIDKLKNSVKANDLMAAALYNDASIQIKKGSSRASQMEKFKQAHYYYSQCTRVYPDHYKAWNNRGLLNVNFLGNTETAVREFRAAVQIKPDFIEGYGNLGFALFKAGKLDSSVIAYRKAIELAPDSLAISSSLSNVLWRAGDSVEAVQLNQRMIASSATSPLPYLNLASFALDKKDTLAAITYFSEALKRDPSNDKVRGFVVGYYLRHGQAMQAAIYQKRQ
jgi:tetratricopeptide (TPR) repeat protein